MARLRNTESVEGDDQSTILRNSSQRPVDAPARHQPTGAPSHSPSPSETSDKENRSQTKSKTPMGPPPPPNPHSRDAHAAKRRRLDGALQEQSSSSRSTTQEPDHQYYDPNQSIEERRRIRKGLRDLNKEAADLRTEWLAPESTGLVDAVTRANTLFQSVKQTSDATIDSRLLVTAGDLAYKKTQQVSVGDGSQGIDVDEFVSKCITFMRLGDEHGTASSDTQQRRRRAAAEIDSDDDDDQGTGREVGDALNWEYFGSHACFPANSRPPAPGFLLGPLSVQKRARAQTQRRQRLRADLNDAVRPVELQSADLQQRENSSLTQTCVEIHNRLGKIQKDGMRRVEEEVGGADLDDSHIEELFEKYNVTDDGGVPLFKFAVNPKSFGQTVENLFYVSFLIKDGMVGLQNDSKGMPSLHEVSRQGGKAGQRDREARKGRGGLRHQAVFSMDFETWQEVIDVFNIQESLIEHRSDEEAAALGSSGWYG